MFYNVVFGKKILSISKHSIEMLQVGSEDE